MRIITRTGSLAIVTVNNANAGLYAVKAQLNKAITVIFAEFLTPAVNFKRISLFFFLPLLVS